MLAIPSIPSSTIAAVAGSGTMPYLAFKKSLHGGDLAGVELPVVDQDFGDAASQLLGIAGGQRPENVALQILSSYWWVIVRLWGEQVGLLGNRAAVGIDRVDMRRAVVERDGFVPLAAVVVAGRSIETGKQIALRESVLVSEHTIISAVGAARSVQRNERSLDGIVGSKSDEHRHIAKAEIGKRRRAELALASDKLHGWLAADAVAAKGGRTHADWSIRIAVVAALVGPGRNVVAVV